MYPMFCVGWLDESLPRRCSSTRQRRGLQWPSAPEGAGEGRTVPSETLKGLAGWPSENKITNQYGMQLSQCDGKVRANLSCLLKLNE